MAWTLPRIRDKPSWAPCDYARVLGLQYLRMLFQEGWEHVAHCQLLGPAEYSEEMHVLEQLVWACVPAAACWFPFQSWLHKMALAGPRVGGKCTLVGGWLAFWWHIGGASCCTCSIQGRWRSSSRCSLEAARSWAAVCAGPCPPPVRTWHATRGAVYLAVSASSFSPVLVLEAVGGPETRLPPPESLQLEGQVPV